MDKRKKTGNKILLIWLMLAVWSLPALIRPIHIHQEICQENPDQEEGTHSHECGSCPICCFALAPFVQPEFTDLPPISVAVYKQLHAVSQEGHAGIPVVTTLRGPPTV